MRLIPILFIILFAILPNLGNRVLAQRVDPSPSVSQFVSPSLTPTPVEYQLPYPGLLPDNPLYILKVIRDRIIFFLISDPLKKAQFDLLQSDKRINSAWYLVQGKTAKNQLIIDTLSKGQNYFSQGLTELSLARKQGFVITDMLHLFLLSAQKHLEVLTQIKSSMSDSSGQLVTELQRVETSIMQLKNTP